MEKGKKVYFLSDLHLGAPYMQGSREAEKRVVRFLDTIKEDAEAIYLLGDILDYWYEYRYVVPRGFVRFFGKLAELSDSGIKIVWLIGNHDIWIFDYIPSELGVEVADGYLIREIKGKNFFLSHGDGVGKLPLSFKMMRSMFRSKLCQFLFSGIHPRWTVPFAYGWSYRSRQTGDAKKISESELITNLKDFTLEFYSQHPYINYFLYGHIHILAKEKISETCDMIVLGEWLKTFSYARFDGEILEILKWKE